MIFVSFYSYSDTEKNIHVCSDKSHQEVQKFTERANRHYKKLSNSSLGIIYTREVLSHQYERESYGQFGFGKSEIPYEILPFDEWVSKREAYIVKKSKKTSNVNELTASVWSFLENNFSTLIISSEFTHTNLDVRADLFAITKDRKVISVEVKSDKDTISRLEKQLKGYQEFSHIVYIATDIKHYSRVSSMLKRNGTFHAIGILLYDEGVLTEEKKPYIHPYINATRVLWKDEYLAMLWEFPFKGKSMFSIDKIIHIVKNIFTVNEFHRMAEYLFTKRPFPENTLDQITDFYSHPEHKKILIEELLKK